jgi:hypothetical protein
VPLKTENTEKALRARRKTRERRQDCLCHETLTGGHPQMEKAQLGDSTAPGGPMLSWREGWRSTGRLNHRMALADRQNQRE